MGVVRCPLSVDDRRPLITLTTDNGQRTTDNWRDHGEGSHRYEDRPRQARRDIRAHAWIVDARADGDRAGDCDRLPSSRFVLVEPAPGQPGKSGAGPALYWYR